MNEDYLRWLKWFLSIFVFYVNTTEEKAGMEYWSRQTQMTHRCKWIKAVDTRIPSAQRSKLSVGFAALVKVSRVYLRNNFWDDKAERNMKENIVEARFNDTGAWILFAQITDQLKWKFRISKQWISLFKINNIQKEYNQI